MMNFADYWGLFVLGGVVIFGLLEYRKELASKDNAGDEWDNSDNWGI